jgi:hypothetical protein
MKFLKIALLGTATLAALSAGARAGELADLKAQIEALNSRISQLESTPAVPAGYKLLTVSEADAIIVPGIDPAMDRFYSDKATDIGLRPAADVPEADHFQWTGFVRAGVVYRDHRDSLSTLLNLTTGLTGTILATDGHSKSVDVVSRAGLKVVGSTETAVGEVGVRITLLATAEALGGTNRSHVTFGDDGYWGWWKIADGLTLAGGISGSLADSANAFDNRCTCAYIQTGGGFGHNDPTQIRLSYESGPISFAIAVEDEANTATTSALAVAGEARYSGDTIGFDLNAGYFDSKDSDPTSSDSLWTVNAGANLALGDMAKIGVAVGVGEDKHLQGDVDSYAKGSAFMGFTLGDTVTAELGGAYTDYKGSSSKYTVGGGLYYTPVAQLTLGVEASYQKVKSEATSYGVITNVAPTPNDLGLRRDSSRETRADMMAVWRF